MVFLLIFPHINYYTSISSWLTLAGTCLGVPMRHDHLQFKNIFSSLDSWKDSPLYTHGEVLHLLSIHWKQSTILGTSYTYLLFGLFCISVCSRLSLHDLLYAMSSMKSAQKNKAPFCSYLAKSLQSNITAGAPYCLTFALFGNPACMYII